MSEETKKQPEVKQYSLTAHEANMLRFVQNHQAAIFSGLLSTIAMSRLAYTVTPNTQFELTPDMSTMRLMELEPPVQATAPADQPAPADDGGSPVVTAPEQTSEEVPSEPTPADNPVSEPVEPTDTTTATQESNEVAEAEVTSEPTEPTAELAQPEAPSEPKTDTQAS